MSHDGNRSYAAGMRQVANNFFSILFRNKFKVIIAILIFFFYLNQTKTASAIFFVIALIAIASVSTIYKYNIKLSFGFELVTMSTVLATIVYGPLVGAFVGLISSVLAEFLPQMIEASSIFWICSVTFSAFLVAIFFSLGIKSLLVLGLISFAFQMIISEPIRLLGPIEVRLQGMLYVVTGLVWNIFVFTKIAPLILNIMT